MSADTTDRLSPEQIEDIRIAIDCAVSPEATENQRLHTVVDLEVRQIETLLAAAESVAALRAQLAAREVENDVLVSHIAAIKSGSKLAAAEAEVERLKAENANYCKVWLWARHCQSALQVALGQIDSALKDEKVMQGAALAQSSADTGDGE